MPMRQTVKAEVMLLNADAIERAVVGEPLSTFAKVNLIAELAWHLHAFSLTPQ